MLRRTLMAAPLLFGLSACVQQVPVPVYAGPSPAAAARCDSRFTVVNASGMTVQELYFSHSSRRDWGADQLGQNVIPPGQSMAFRAGSAGLYDFRAVWANGNAAELRDVDVCAYGQIRVGRGGLSAS